MTEFTENYKQDSRLRKSAPRNWLVGLLIYVVGAVYLIYACAYFGYKTISPPTPA